MKKIISLVFVVLIILSITAIVPASAADFGCDVLSSADAVYLENLDSGAVVYQKNSETKVSPASTTKIMTYIIVAENVPDFDNTMVTVTENALSTLDPGSSIMGLSYHIGEQFSVKDLLYGLMLPSGNDAALVLADYVGHGVSGFVDMMNRKAAQLNCDSTHFVNPHGLYSPQHYTTAKDLATITKYALTSKSFTEITSTTSYLPNGFNEKIKTSNFLIDSTQEDGKYYYEYATGVKTGFTDEAGKCLVSTATKGDYNYLCVVLGSPYSQIEQINYAMYDTRDFYEWAFNNIAFTTLYSPEDKLGRAWVNNVWGAKYVDLVPSEDINCLLPKNYNKDLVKADISAESEVYAPIKKGDKAGTLTVYYDGEKIGTCDLVCNEDINWHVTNYIAHVIFNFVKNHIVLIVFVVLLLVVTIVIVRTYRKRQKIEAEKRRYR